MTVENMSHNAQNIPTVSRGVCLYWLLVLTMSQVTN